MKKVKEYVNEFSWEIIGDMMVYTFILIVVNYAIYNHVISVAFGRIVLLVSGFVLLRAHIGFYRIYRLYE